MKMAYSVFNEEEKKDGGEICSARAGKTFAMLSQNMCNIVENFISFNFSLSLFIRVVSWRLKCSFSKQEITKMHKFFRVQYFLPKWHVIKTKHTCRFGEFGIGRTSGGLKFPEPTSLRSVCYIAWLVAMPMAIFATVFPDVDAPK
jgi:hypothetical protein